MVDENDSAETNLDGETKKAAGRPRKSQAKSEPVVEPEDTTTEDGKKEQAPKDGAPTGRIIPEGEEVKINKREENGVLVATETVFLKKRLPKSKRYTYILLATEGMQV